MGGDRRGRRGRGGRRHWSGWHEERLAELAGRIRALLPYEHFPRATAELEAACEAFERDPVVREEVAALLLEHSLERLEAEREARAAFPAAA